MTMNNFFAEWCFVWDWLVIRITICGADKAWTRDVVDVLFPIYWIAVVDVNFFKGFNKLILELILMVLIFDWICGSLWHTDIVLEAIRNEPDKLLQINIVIVTDELLF